MRQQAQTHKEGCLTAGFPRSTGPKMPGKKTLIPRALRRRSRQIASSRQTASFVVVEQFAKSVQWDSNFQFGMTEGLRRFYKAGRTRGRPSTNLEFWKVAKAGRRTPHIQLVSAPQISHSRSADNVDRKRELHIQRARPLRVGMG